MYTSLPRHVYPIEIPKGMVKLGPAGVVPTFDRAPTGWDFTVRGGDPLHVWSDRQQIEPPMVVEFAALIRNATQRVDGRSDLARMDRVFEDRGTNVDCAHAVCVHTSAWSDLLGRRKFCV